MVTGASGGIGGAIALAMARAGADIVAIGRRPERMSEVQGHVAAAGRDFLAIAADLADVGSVGAASEEAWAWKGGVDSLVNAAGALVREELLEVSVSEWDATFAVNVRGPFFLTQAFARSALSSGRSGAVVNITSTAGEVTTGAPAPYSASKAALIQLTRVLAIRLAPAIRVNAVGPAYVTTHMNADWLGTPENRDWVLARTPLGRVGEPSDVVGAVVFLASGLSSYITGQHLLVDGGWTAQ